MNRRLAVLLCALATPLAPLPHADAAPAPAAVLAVVDSGIDPYHAVFRDRSPRAYQHPSTYLPGFPRDAVALPITLDARDYWSAVRADCKRVWSKVVPGRLYWFPGTKIVGAISFDPTRLPFDCSQDQPTGGAILDELDHGTMTASRAVAPKYGSCPECRVVSVQFQTSFGVINTKEAAESTERAVSWAAANATWIDAQSDSWGVLPVPDPTGEGGLFFEHPSLTRTVEDAARRHLSFWATGNGVGNFGGQVGMPTLGGHYTPSAIRVGAQDSGQVTTWSGQLPHVVGDGCHDWAAKNRTTDESGDSVGGGTSAATPYVAGGALAALLHARRITGDTRTGVRDGVVARGRRTRGGPLADGVLTVEEWRDVVLKTATARPAPQPEDGPACPLTDPLYRPTPVAWRQVPEGAPEYLFIGYGAVDRPAVALARRVLDGAAPVPDRAQADTFFSADRAARDALHAVYRGP
ncbi:MAG TPA: S8/S53 family peptidase [Frankiaceae bacterium]|nr:S8/S53 family peptidase [Frankiaceae bacterium]